MDTINNVIDIVKQIPYGRVTTYGAIASFIGLKSSARIVGYILNKCAVQYSLPAHRVVNRNGMLTGKKYFGNQDEMAELLRAEGIPVVNDQVCNFEKYFWDPENLIKIK